MTKTKDLPVNVEIINREDIENASQVTAGEVLLNTLTNMTSKENTPIQAAQNGFFKGSSGDASSDPILVLIDGRKAGTGVLSFFPSEAIERIEVLKGPASAVYGSNAMGGVINIITKKGSGLNAASYSAELGSFNYRKFGATTSGTINNFISYFMSGSYYSQGDHTTIQYGKAYSSAKDMLNLMGSLIVDISENQNLKIGYNISDLDYQSPRVRGDKYPEQDLSRLTYDKLLIGVDFDYDLTLIKDRLDLRVLGFYNRYEYLFDAKRRDDLADNFYDSNKNTYWKDYIYETTGAETSVFYSLPLGIVKNDVVAGYSFEKFESDTAKYVYSSEYSVWDKPGNIRYNHSPYVQDTVNIMDDITLVLGARYDYYDMKFKKPENFKYMSATDQAKYKSGKETYKHLTPRVGVSYSPMDILKVRAHYGEGIVVPSASRLLGFESPSATYQGNPGLDPETSRSYETGFNISLPMVDFVLDYKYVNYKNKFVKIKINSSPKVYKYINSDNDYNYQCLDGGVVLRLGKYLRSMGIPVAAKLSSNFIYNLKYEDSEGVKIQDINQYEIKNNLNVNFMNFSFNVSYQHAGEAVGDSETGEKRDPYNYIDANMKVYFLDNYEFFAAVYNLTEVEEFVLEDPMMERHYKVGLKASF